MTVMISPQQFQWNLPKLGSRSSPREARHWAGPLQMKYGHRDPKQILPTHPRPPFPPTPSVFPPFPPSHPAHVRPFPLSRQPPSIPYKHGLRFAAPIALSLPNVDGSSLCPWTTPDSVRQTPSIFVALETPVANSNANESKNQAENWPDDGICRIM